MVQRLQLAANPRAGAAKAARRHGALPAVLYGHGLKNQVLAVDRRQFLKVFQAAGFTTLINVAVTGEADPAGDHTVLIREVQWHPVRGDAVHVDLYQVRLDEAITARVPLTFTGESPAVKELGGILVRNLDDVEITALPQDLPHDISVDISALSVFDAPLRVRDLRVPANVKLMVNADAVVALIQPPRSEEELKAELAEAVTEDVTTVEGVVAKPPEGEPAAEGAAEAPADKKAAEGKK